MHVHDACTLYLQRLLVSAAVADCTASRLIGPPNIPVEPEGRAPPVMAVLRKWPMTSNARAWEHPARALLAIRVRHPRVRAAIHFGSGNLSRSLASPRTEHT